MPTTSSKTVKPAPKLTAVEKAVQAVRAGIKEGAYAPGQRLIEADLTSSLGVSRGPLREAMWRLAGEGLVKIEPNRGVVVRKFSRDETRHLFEIREMLEGLAARQAAQNIGIGDNRTRLKQAHRAQEQYRKAGNLSAYILANEHFHDVVVALSGNEMLSNLIAQMRLPVFRFQFKQMMTSPVAMNASADQHLEVAEAILEGQSSQAERSMRRHVRESGQRVLELPDNNFA
ncbi:MAG: GntR family transcriptional regulator [Gammaproteobacteria bacterium]|nr:GntR family transcriptional regulator [Gammaproteobacteria bacterium]